MACALAAHRCTELCARTPAQAQAYLDGLRALEAICAGAGGAAAAPLAGRLDAAERALGAAHAAAQRQEAALPALLAEAAATERRRGDEAADRLRAQVGELEAALRARAETVEAQAAAHRQELGELHAQQAALHERHRQDLAQERAAVFVRLAAAEADLRTHHAQELALREAAAERLRAAQARELEEARQAAASGNVRGRVAELGVHAFCERLGKVVDIKRDGVRGDLLLVFGNKLAVKLEVKCVETYQAQYQEAAFAHLDVLERLYGVSVVSVAVVNTHPEPKPVQRVPGLEVAEQLLCYAARDRVTGHYFAGGAATWQPALFALCDHIRSTAVHEVDGGADLEAYLQQQEKLQTSLEDFHKWLEDERRRTQLEARALEKRLRQVTAKLDEVQRRLAENDFVNAEREELLRAAAQIVACEGWAPLQQLRAWEERHPELTLGMQRFYRARFELFRRDVSAWAEQPTKRPRHETPTGNGSGAGQTGTV